MKIILILIFFTLTNHCNAIRLVCTIDGEKCKFQGSSTSVLVSLKDEREITSKALQFTEGSFSWKSDDANRIKEFSSCHQVVKFFPHGLTKYFKNLESIEICHAQLEEVTKEDLKEFGRNLKLLKLDYNLIEVIHADLFESNPNLYWIDLSSNKIKHIDEGTFKGLKKLETLYISRNPCTSDDNQSKALEVIKRVEKTCKNPAIKFRKFEVDSSNSVQLQVSWLVLILCLKVLNVF